MDLHDDSLWQKVKNEISKNLSMDPLRDWLDIDENRKGYRGNSNAIGTYYCIPAQVLIECGLDSEEVFMGRTYYWDMEFKRKHVCAFCEKTVRRLNVNMECENCED